MHSADGGMQPVRDGDSDVWLGLSLAGGAFAGSIGA
jgi:hypothetical protein